MPFLKVEGLYKSFGGLMAVHNVEFEVEEGEIVGLIGPNGCGWLSKLPSGLLVFSGQARTIRMTSGGSIWNTLTIGSKRLVCRWAKIPRPTMCAL
jgi:ABC-type uncharacterized transport system ATPase subunit